MRRVAAAAVLAAAWPSCGCRAGDGAIDPEERIEAARARPDAADVLRAAIESAGATDVVRLRAIRGLVEAGRVDQVRKAFGRMPRGAAEALADQAARNITWLAMAASVPDGRLRQTQVRAKDALVLLEEWMSPDVRREARSVVVRWFAADLASRAKAGDVPLVRADPAVRSAVCAAASLRTARVWTDLPEIAAIVAGCGNEIDLQRLRGEAMAAFIEAPFGTPDDRQRARGGAIAAIKTLRGTFEPALEPLAGIVRAAGEPEGRRVDAAAKLAETGLRLGALGLASIVADDEQPAALRAALGAALVSEGDGIAAAAAVSAGEPEVFDAVRKELWRVRAAGQAKVFADALAARAARLPSIPGRCDALAEALAAMGPRRSAKTAHLLLRSQNSVIMSIAIEVLARVGTAEDRGALDVLTGSRAASPCWPDRTVGGMAAGAIDVLESRGEAGPAPAAGDEDGREPEQESDSPVQLP